MSDILRKAVYEIVQAVITGGGIAFLFALPLFLVGWGLHRRRKKYKAEATDPFVEMPLRPPGESLRKKIEELTDDYDSELGVTAILSSGAAVLASSTVMYNHANSVVLCFLGLVVIIAAISAWRNFSRIQKQLWDYRLGFEGERAVGEWLNRLAADGFEIFHDMPFDKFNIDHIIVGPPGVFAIETKTRRKPAHLEGSAKATVIFDGNALQYPLGSPETKAVEQAALNAKTLSKFLSSATGEQTVVSPILALPGWWVDRKARGVVKVLNPKEIQHSFSSKDGPPLSPQRIKQIAHQLTERCRLEKAK
ncbi:MAG: nuclease-related domain-containing protein [Opitutus sp.]